MLVMPGTGFFAASESGRSEPLALLYALAIALLCEVPPAPYAAAQKPDAGNSDRAGATDKVERIFRQYCFECHGDGGEEGGLTLDKLLQQSDRKSAHEKWLAVWKNLRAQTMPPADDAQPANS